MRCLHPAIARILHDARGDLPPEYQRHLDAFRRRHLSSLNTAIDRLLESRLQMVELFAGIGGLGSGLEAALGAVTVLQAEKVPARRHLLAHRFPLAIQVEDVKRVLELPAPAPADRLVVCGGFPCRGASRANLHGAKGMEHPQTALWKVMAKVVERWRPVMVIWENVTALRSRGLDQVIEDLGGLGYNMLWGTLKASRLGAPHERDRVFGVAIRQDAPRIQVFSRPLRAGWLEWGEDIPPNDFDAPGGQMRVRALGDAVVPAVAYSVGLIAVRMLAGWRPAARSRHTEDLPPMQGWLEQGQLYQVPAPFVPASMVPGQRWVVVDERFENPETPLEVGTYPPAIGRIAWWDGESDNVDVELPGGEIMPFPPEWVREQPWPTPVESDGSNRGAWGQYNRKAPGLNALAQLDTWMAEDGVYAAQMIDLISGRGVGPAFLEWVMGFPVGWTLPMADAGRAGKDASPSPILCHTNRAA